MASTYLTNNKIYINWYDILKQKCCTRATGLNNSPENIIIAQEMADKIQKKLDEVKEDIIKIFNGLDNPELRKSSMFKTLIYLAFYTGLRSSDLMTITAEKINIEKRELNYYSPKRKTFRSIAFHEDLIPILTNRIEEVKTGKLLEYSETEAIGRALRRYFDILKINDKGYSARTFRKTFITLSRSYGINPSVVAELVGHEHQTTADKFYNRIDHKQMIKELKKFKRPIK